MRRTSRTTETFVYRARSQGTFEHLGGILKARGTLYTSWSLIRRTTLCVCGLDINEALKECNQVLNDGYDGTIVVITSYVYCI